eukprot:TRINITY_DN102780_c0_g1_i1.p1 TRINITY_DN102780_c0_g1~~TRINITY_DN102780_c0_g1_i1.p1  ORF type:complete len:312 (-),score=72.04 TRINITY_DN102780_c0_g1_i1:51-986(-)
MLQETMAGRLLSLLRRVPRRTLVMLLIMQLVLPALAVGTGKKNKMFAAYPTIMKFFMFWWCVFVACVMMVYVLDHLLGRFRGPARVDYTIEHTFKGSADREAYWAQLVDPSAWSPTHPVLWSADIRMVKCGLAQGNGGASGDADAATSGEAAAEKEKEEVEPVDAPSAANGASKSDAVQKTVRPVPLGCLKPGLGMILRYKEGNWRAGLHFCTRECVSLETPGPKEPWKILMRTVDVGGGYPFKPDSEEVMIELHPPAEDGSMLCALVGRAACQSRFFRWWSGLQRSTESGAEAYLEAVGEEVRCSRRKAE